MNWKQWENYENNVIPFVMQNNLDYDNVSLTRTVDCHSLFRVIDIFHLEDLLILFYFPSQLQF